MPLLAEQLSKIMPNCNTAIWLDPLNAALSARHIDIPMRAAAFLAHIAVESGETRVLIENMNHSADRLMAVWPKRFPTAELAASYAHDPVKLGNFVYANRLGNGPPSTGDGFRYRGRGLLQATGKDHYSEAAGALRLDLVNHPELLEQPVNASAEAAWWWEKSSLNPIADAGQFERSTIIINGGLTGYPDRVAYWRRALVVLGAQSDGSDQADLAQRVQKALNDRRASPALSTDGIWGPLSEAAADRFRAQVGLAPADGIDNALLDALGIGHG